MTQLQEKIEALSRKISELAAQQTDMRKELFVLMDELRILKQEALNASIETAINTQPEPVQEAVIKPTPVVEKVTEIKEVIAAPGNKPVQKTPVYTPGSVKKPAHRPLPQSNRRSGTSIEEFVGKNLASKIGILITIVGIFIGARYAIEHNLVSPVMRIVSGYIGGLALIAVAIKLKKKYEAYSSVLMGGGLCVMYFITFIAWSVYQLFPQLAAFGLMLLFTVAIIYVAIWYNRVIIAHLGQVGAYAIPFLLSNDSGNYGMLFTYIGIINAGILVLSFFKNWRSLFHIAYILTWLIFSTWFVFTYSERHFELAATVLFIYFLLFYATFLSYKLIKKEQYDIRDIFLLLSNAFIFYGFGYGLLAGHAATESWPGIFTIANALIHLVVSFLIRNRLHTADRSLYYLVLGLVVVFLTIAVPVQLDGNWVTLLWTAEGVLLFYVGRKRNAIAYEKLAVALILLGMLSLLQDWAEFHQQWPPMRAFVNICFLTGLLVMAALTSITRVNANHKVLPDAKTNPLFQYFFDYIVPALLLAGTYTVFFLELSLHFRWLISKLPHTNSVSEAETEIQHFSDISLFLYTQVFVLVLLMINKRLKNQWLAVTALLGTLFLSIILLASGWPSLNEMANTYYRQPGHSTYFQSWNVWIRYFLLIAMAAMLVIGTRAVKAYNKEPVIDKGWWLLVYTMILAAISYEYLNWTTVSGSNDQYKTGLSIIWGLYALTLVVYGIWKKQKYIRLVSIGLFVITILKLFFYDLSEAGTITKTISFISLGVILLLVSYLYNRYKDTLFGAEVAPQQQQEEGEE